jgi:hypothetical protein
MGAQFQIMKAKGTPAEVKRVFEQVQEEDRYENGHSYSGGFGMANGLTFVRPNVVFTEKDAEAWLDANCQKWEAALAVKLGNDEYLIGALCSS